MVICLRHKSGWQNVVQYIVVNVLIRFYFIIFHTCKRFILFFRGHEISIPDTNIITLCLRKLIRNNTKCQLWNSPKKISYSNTIN